MSQTTVAQDPTVELGNSFSNLTFLFPADYLCKVSGMEVELLFPEVQHLEFILTPRDG